MPAAFKITAAIVALSLLGAFGIWFWKQAGNDARISIERQDNAAGDNADDARSRFDTCADGLWDYGAGKCCGSSPRVGTDLIGARGATSADQRKIDRTVVGLCAGGVWSTAECAGHGERKP